MNKKLIESHLKSSIKMTEIFINTLELVKKSLEEDNNDLLEDLIIELPFEFGKLNEQYEDLKLVLNE